MKVTDDVGFELHPVEASVNTKVLVPAAIPCTMPALLTVATDGFKLIQVPPTVGVSVVTEPAQTEVGPDTFTVGFPLTVMTTEALEVQPVFVSVNVKVAVPADTPVIRPALVIVATNGLLLTHVPPKDGKIDVLPPIQIEDGPFNVIGGLPFTLI